MVEIPNISQTNTMGSNNSQIGVQYNHEEHHHGLSVADATSMAFAMFREYYPQLRQEALASLDEMVTEKLKRIPADCIVPPIARITVPTIQKASITEEPEIREMYANLLANSMNAIVKNGVHPSFVEIINQISPDEAKILKYFFGNNTIPTLTLRAENEKHEGVDVIRNFSDIGEKSGCEEKYSLNKYFDNLIRLGLVGSAAPLSSLTDKTKYEPLKVHPVMEAYKKGVEGRPAPYNIANFNESFLYLSDFGKSFCGICLGNIKVIRIMQQE